MVRPSIHSHLAATTTVHAAKWPAQIAALVKKNTPTRPMLDAVIDGGGAEIMQQVSKYLKHAGKVVCYGMTGSPERIGMTMREVMRNQQLLGASALTLRFTEPMPDVSQAR